MLHLVWGILLMLFVFADSVPFDNLLKFVIIIFLILCLIYSDEEDEDTAALMYLPVSPEIDEPEEPWQADGAVSCTGLPYIFVFKQSLSLLFFHFFVLWESIFHYL